MNSSVYAPFSTIVDQQSYTKKSKKKLNQSSSNLSTKNSTSNSSLSNKASRQNSDTKSNQVISKKSTTHKSNHALGDNSSSLLTSPSSKIPYNDKSATFLTDVLLSLNYSNNSVSNSNLINNETKKVGKKNSKQQQKSKNMTNNANKPSSLGVTQGKQMTNARTQLNEKLKTNKNVQKIQQVNRPVTTKKENDIPATSSRIEIINDFQKAENSSTKSNKNSNIRARYWAYLFENLKRSVNEIYQTCEYDNSITECKEVILILENCIKDFRSLTTRIKKIKDIENTDMTKKGLNSVAWELGKISTEMTTSTLSKNESNLYKSSKDINNASNLNNQISGEGVITNIDGGFKEFLPYSSINKFSKLKSSNVKNKRYSNQDFDEDEDEEIDDLDDDYDNDADNENELNEFIYILNDEDPENDPIDLLNHETFSDMQSINTEDMSFNALSISPPLPLSSKSQATKTKQIIQSPPHSAQNLFFENPAKNYTSQQQQINYNQAFDSTLNESSLNFYQQFPLLMMPSSSTTIGSNQNHHNIAHQTTQFPLPSGPNSSLNSSLAFNGMMQKPPGLLGYASLFSNPSELSPFNYQTNKFNATYNFYNPNKDNAANSNPIYFNNFAESFDNASSFCDNSTRLENISDKNLDNNNENKENFYRKYKTDDEFELAYLKNTTKEANGIGLNRQSNFNKYDPMLKFYEEEEENIAFELKQDKRLLSVLAKEAKLTKQLSMEKLIHFSHEFHEMEEECDDVEMGISKVSTDLETTNDTERNTPLNVYWKNCTANATDKMCTDSEVEGVPRTPGKSTQMHEKLSFLMSRKTSPNERRRKHEEKQARAQEKREQFYQDRLNKLRELTRKIEEVSELKKKLLRAKKATMKAKLQRAEEKRQYLLRLKSTKASVEEQKAHEIAFINSLAAQNRKHDILEKYEKRHEAIKQNLEEERLRKQEEQKAKEHAAELRRKELETQRTAKLKEMLEKRKIKQSKIEQTQMEKEKERIETARAKEKTREMRLAIIEAQFQANRQQAKKRMLQKQEEWSKRHESNLEEIRKKAFEMSILRFSTEDNNHNGEAPTPVPYENAKYCNVCSVVINSEVKLKSHLGGIKHQQIMKETNQGKNLTKSEIEEYNLNCIIDVPKENNEKEMILSQERKKLMKKRLKKLKNKILTKGIEYETSKKSSNETNQTSLNTKSKLPKLIRELEKSLNSSAEKFVNLDKNCSEINRILQQANAKQQQMSNSHQSEQFLFRSNDGFSVALKLLELICQSPNDLNHYSGVSTKTPINLINLIINASKNNYDACIDLILTNKLFSLIEILNIHSNIMLSELTPNELLASSSSSSISSFTTGKKNQISIEWFICSSLIHLIASIFTTLNNESSSVQFTAEISLTDNSSLIQRANDLISLMTSYGLIDNLSVFFINIRGPLDDEHQTVEILNNCLNLLVSVTKFLAQKKPIDIFSPRKIDDSTQLISTIKATNLVNIISMLYGMLHKDASTTPVKFSNSNVKKQTITTLELTKLSLKLLNQMIVLDLNMVQNLLGEECLSLQLRHISSYLIWYLNLNATTNNNNSNPANANINAKCEEVLHEIILLIGYFTVLNVENQIKIELGTPPTILQQLCNLSFKYFSDKKLISILYPTLICCCYNNEKNKCVLTSELSAETLANFIQEKINEETNKAYNNSGHFEDKFEFNRRFPVKLFGEALAYFSENREK